MAGGAVTSLTNRHRFNRIDVQLPYCKGRSGGLAGHGSRWCLAADVHPPDAVEDLVRKECAPLQETH